jgi:hypothetical protein
METLFFAIVSGFFGLIYQRMEKMESKIDRLEEQVIFLMTVTPKRRNDERVFDEPD